MNDSLKLTVWLRPEKDAVLLADNLTELHRLKKLGSWKAPCLWEVHTTDGRNIGAVDLVQRITWEQDGEKLVPTGTTFHVTRLGGGKKPPEILVLDEEQVVKIVAYF